MTFQSDHRELAMVIAKSFCDMRKVFKKEEITEPTQDELRLAFDILDSDWMQNKMRNVNDLPDNLQVGDVVRILDIGGENGLAFELVERAPKPEIAFGVSGVVKFRSNLPQQFNEEKDENEEIRRGIRVVHGYMTVASAGSYTFVHDNKVIEFTPDTAGNTDELKRLRRVLKSNSREIENLENENQRLAELVGSEDVPNGWSVSRAEAIRQAIMFHKSWSESLNINETLREKMKMIYEEEHKRIADAIIDKSGASSALSPKERHLIARWIRQGARV